MNLFGVILGLYTLAVVALGHIFVKKGEYYFTKKIWVAFLMMGFFFAVASVLAKSDLLSGMMGIASFTFFWAILEVIEQEKRVKKGWFPANPKRQKLIP